MRKAIVYYNGRTAGVLTENNDKSYIFLYDESYLLDREAPGISLTLPKRKEEFHSPYLFPFFFNMLAEGVNKKLQERQFQIDEDDSFGFLLKTAGYDTIGAITVKSLEE